MMADVKYKVVFLGEIFPGNQLDQVKSKLANLFKVDIQTIEKIFSGNPHKIKSNLDQGNARKYSYAMAKLGAVTYIEQEIIEYLEPAEPVERIKPVQHIKPAETVKPVQHIKPVETVKPVQHNKPVEPALAIEDKLDDDSAFTETCSFDMNAINAYFEKRAAERAELERTGDHRIISLDEIDEPQSPPDNKDNPGSTDTRKILDPSQIAGLINTD